ncbi:MAG: response regulator transcription factor, partial [Burkholderiaceae bacterium]|nr:response regulator transcription factor [Burkholderiaceae bacterium]
FHHDVASGANIISRLLRAAGYACAVYRSEQALFDGLSAGSCDLLIVEVPDGQFDTIALLRAVKAAAGGVLPVLLLVQSDQVEATVTFLTAGADDYLVRPVREADLLARVQVLLRCAWPERVASGQLRQGAFLLDPHTGQATVNGMPVALTRKEFALALLLFAHVGQPLSRATILDAVWQGDRDATFRSIDTHVSRVRTKLGLRPANGFRLAPVYGYGYLLERVSG